MNLAVQVVLEVVGVVVVEVVDEATIIESLL